jgi:hypothetical protein
MNTLLLTLLIYLGIGLLCAKIRLIYEWKKQGFFMPNIFVFILCVLIWPYMLYLIKNDK